MGALISSILLAGGNGALNPYYIVIGLSLIIICSYFFNIISKKTNVPSVLMLIVLGILLKQGMGVIGINANKFFPFLELLGITGLIFIVLEAALDLELKKEKWPIIWKSSLVALVGLLLSVGICSLIIKMFIIDDYFTALIYAVPLSIMSSAIVIPSVGGLSHDKKEFMIYESTVSDILGIMLFYFLVGNANADNAKTVIGDIALNITATIVLATVVSYFLVIVFQKITTHVKLFLLIAVLLLFYAVGKLFHLSSLIIILVFGMVLKNHHLFFRGQLKKYIKPEKINNILQEFNMLTIESAFVIRTFFFVIFGITISLVSLVNFRVAIYSVLLVASLYGVRYLVLRLINGADMKPLLSISPRGLITILLFFGIPVEYHSDAFDSGILLYCILITNIIMTVALIKNGMTPEPVKDVSLANQYYTPELKPNTLIVEKENTDIEPNKPPTNPALE